MTVMFIRSGWSGGVVMVSCVLEMMKVFRFVEVLKNMMVSFLMKSLSSTVTILLFLDFLIVGSMELMRRLVLLGSGSVVGGLFILFVVLVLGLVVLF